MLRKHFWTAIFMFLTGLAKVQHWTFISYPSGWGAAAIIAARALATYLIPGCVGRGVRLGSESSSVGGVWKSGNLEIWDFGNFEIWGPGNPEILRFGDLEIQNVGIQKIKKIKSLKIQIRSAQNVGKVWISRKQILPALFGAI